jgi:AraC-like DNA-binding protein
MTQSVSVNENSTERTYRGRDAQFADFYLKDAGLHREVAWRQSLSDDLAERPEHEIEVSRWTDPRIGERSRVRHGLSTTPRDSHIVSVALKAAELKLSTDSGVLFDGLMPSGTLHVSGPGQRLAAEFRSPYDFLHLRVSNEFLGEEGFLPGREQGWCCPDVKLLFRDSVAETLSRSLVEADDGCHRLYVESVCKAIVMRAMMRQERPKPNGGLPKWRMKRLQQHLAAHIAGSISLSDMAAAAGLSKMHFAAQFRATTGFRPHEYLLFQRIEQAKIAMTNSELSLAEIALSVGFQAQAHFSTVFKRFTGKSPGQWKQEYQSAL